MTTPTNTTAQDAMQATEYITLRRELLMRFMRKELDKDSYELMLGELNSLYQISTSIAGGMSLHQAVAGAGVGTAPGGSRPSTVMPMPAAATPANTPAQNDLQAPPRNTSAVIRSPSGVVVRQPTQVQLNGHAYSGNSFGDPNAAASSAVALKPGDLVLDYTITNKLGRGGMGMVYRAEDKEGKPVAVKLFPTILLGNAREMARVHNTFEAVKKLSHPSIANVYRLAEDTLFGIVLVMEFCEGMTLDDYVENLRANGTAVTVGEVCRVLTPIAQALDYAHSLGVIHRDIKPQNIMLKADGSGVKLIDFGLADQIRTSMVSVSNSTMGEVAGTRAYMASEQWQGHVADGKTDQYALACVAYEMLAGHPPFLAGEPAVLERCHRAEPVPAIDNVNALVNAVFWIDDPIQTDFFALAKKRASRFGSCMSFIQALREREPEQSSYPPNWRVFGTRAMSHQRQVRTAVAVGDGKVFATSDEASTVCIWDLGTRQAIRRLRLKSGTPTVMCVSTSGRGLLMGTDTGQLAMIDIVSGRLMNVVSVSDAPVESIAVGGEHLIAVGSADCILRLYSEADLQPFSHTEPVNAPITALAWSQTGLLAWGQANGEVTVVATDCDAPLGEFKAHNGVVKALQFSRESRSLVTAGEDGCLHSYSMAGKHRMHTFIQNSAPVINVEFLPGTDRFVAILGDGKCYTFELYRHVQVGVASAVNAKATAGCLLSSRSLALVGEQSGLIRLVNLDRSSEVISGQSYLYPTTSLEVMEDRGLLLTSHNSGELLIWDLHTQKMTQRRMMSDGAILDIGLVDRDAILAILHEAGTIGFYQALTNKRIAADKLKLPGKVTAMACSALTNEMLVATSSGELRAYAWPLKAVQPEPYNEEMQFSCFDGEQPGAAAQGDRVAFKPEEGRLVAQLQICDQPIVALQYDTRHGLLLSLTAGGQAHLINLRNRQVVTELAVPGATAGAFSPDGSLIAMADNAGNAILFDQAGKQLSTRKHHKDRISTIAFTLDGRRVLTGGKDQTIRSWRHSDNSPPTTFSFNSSVVTFHQQSNNTLLVGLEDGTTVMTAPIA